jgi:hypothetical protein
MYPLLKVTWVDSCGREGWILKEDVLTILPLEIITIGQCLVETDEHLLLALSVADDDSQMDGIICIPKCCVKETLRLGTDPIVS